MSDEGMARPAKRQRLSSPDLLPSEEYSGELIELDGSENEEKAASYDAIYDQDFYKPTGFGEMGQYLRNKRKKLAVQRQQFLDNEQEEHPKIFENVAVYINGFTKTPLATLSRYLTIYGGEYVPYLDKKGLITHIVAAELTPTKRKEFRAYKVVTEDWIVESVAAGRLLDWRQYRSYGATIAFEAKDDVTGGLPSTQMSILKHVKPPSPLKRATTPPLQATVVEVLDSSEDKKGKKRDYGISSELESYLPQAKNNRRTALLDDEAWRLKHTAVAGMDYIEGYYATSRLHHLSTWKAALPHMVERLRSELKAAGQTPRAKAVVVKPSKPLKGTPEDKRTIFHVDFDSFFVACGLASRPHLRGKPVAVCHATGNADAASSTSEIASCSYEARSCGVKNGISLGRARELCPDIQAMPYEFDLYAKNSESMYKILLMQGDAIEAVSVDEAYIDVSSRVSTTDAALTLAEQIRTEIREATQCEVSIGISYNVVLARLATKRAKPASAYFLRESEALDFLAPLGVDEIPGVGWSMRHKLEEDLGVKTLADALRVGKSRLRETMGPKKGEDIYNFARGVDTRLLKPPTERKSVSAEINYVRFQSDEEVEDFMRNLSRWLSRTLKQVGVRGRHLTLKVMRRAQGASVETPKFLGHGACDVVNNSSELGMATDDAEFMGETAVKLMIGLKIPPRELRGIGLQMTQLDSGLSNSQQRLTFGGKTTVVPDSVAVQPLVVQAKLTESDSSRSRSTTPVHAALAAGFGQTRLGTARVKVGKKSGKPVQSKIGFSGKLKDPRRVMPFPKDPSNKELQEMGIDPQYWHDIGSKHQLDVWRAAWEQLEAMGGVRYIVHEPSLIEVLPSFNPFRFKYAEEPAFGSARTVEEVQDKVERWIEKLGIEGQPHDDDVNKLRTFLVAKASRDAPLGQDLAFVFDILLFWQVLIKDGSTHWRAALETCRKAVNEVSGAPPLAL